MDESRAWFKSSIGFGAPEVRRDDALCNVAILTDEPLIIKDDGPGIAPEHHERVFAIFQTLQGKDNSDSTGVGLAIVKKIVETEQGTIRLESSLGRAQLFM